jgi:hypothetical protein
MEITKKNRTELKSYFLTNKIPTQKNFEDFIDAGLNQTDDGIMKPQGRPLAIQAEGDDSGTQEVLQLFKKLVDNNPRWSINMNPRTDPNNTATGKLGLNISDAAGVSRFFIKGDDGSIGLGTITPAQKLHVQVNNSGLNLPVYVRNLASTETGGNAVGIGFLNEAQGDWPKAAVVHERTAGFGVGSLRFLVSGNVNNSSVSLADAKMTINSSGNVGIGSTNPGVPLTFTDTLGDKISLWGQAGNTYGFGIQPSLMQIHTSGADGDIAFGFGSSAALNETMRIKGNGNMGLGTNAPQAKFHVVGGAIMPSIGSSPTSGITFPANPGGGVGDTAYIKYYSRGGESTTLEIGVGNDPDDNISLMASGNIGINTLTPAFPLSFNNNLGDKIALWGASGDHYGFGIQGGLLQIYTDAVGADVAFGYGTSAALTETMRVKGNGNVGIGTNAPAAKLQVVGGAIMPSPGNAETAGIMFPKDAGGGSGDMAYMRYYARTGATLESMTLEIGIKNDADDHIAIMPSGSVGIGTLEPKAKLHVMGGIYAGTSDIYFTSPDHVHSGLGNAQGFAAIENAKDYGALMLLGRTGTDNLRIVKLWDYLQIDAGQTQNFSNYAFVNQAGAGRNAGASGNVTISLKTGGRILCPEIDVYSDRRIKKDFTYSDPESDLKMLNQIRITDFRYKDELAFGSNYQKGVIAQEVETVFPDAVSTHPDFIPDIFAQSESLIISEGMMTVTMKDGHGLETDDIVRLLTSTGPKEVSIVKISENVFSVNDWTEEVSEVFVYGKKTNDFRTVDYNSIFSLGISAIQELYKQVQSLKDELFGIKNLISARLTPAN